jgi:hypothetical protein
MSSTVDPYLYQVARFLNEQAGDSSPELAQVSEEMTASRTRLPEAMRRKPRHSQLHCRSLPGHKDWS